MNTRAQRKIAARATQVRFIRTQNTAIQDRILLTRDMEAWPEMQGCPSPVVRQLIREVGTVHVLNTVERANAQLSLLTQDAVIAAARAHTRVWNGQRKALERALDTGALVYNSDTCGYRTRTGRTVNLGLYGAIRVTEDYRARKEIGNSIIVNVDRTRLPDGVCRWIDRQTVRHDRLAVDYVTSPKIVDFIRGLRAHMRQCNREVELNLSSFVTEG